MLNIGFALKRILRYAKEVLKDKNKNVLNLMWKFTVPIKTNDLEKQSHQPHLKKCQKFHLKKSVFKVLEIWPLKLNNIFCGCSLVCLWSRRYSYCILCKTFLVCKVFDFLKLHSPVSSVEWYSYFSEYILSGKSWISNFIICQWAQQSILNKNVP